MTLSISTENKSNLSITDEAKPTNATFDTMPVSFDSVSTTFAEAGSALSLEGKSNISIVNESKS